jgi:hypothetical protein
MSSLALVDWKKDVLETAADRFERRLTEESAALRLEMGNTRADLKNDIWQLRSDMAHLHTSLIKWMFAFWIGQLAFTVAIVGILLRALRLP